MSIVFHPNWLQQQNTYMNTLPQGNDAEAHFLQRLAQDEREFAQWLYTVIADSTAQPSAAGRNLVKQMENELPNDLVVLHGIHTSPGNPPHVTVQYGATGFIGHINLAWNSNKYDVSAVNNGAVKRLVAIMVEELSAKTIQSYVGVVKAVIASAVNGEGEELYPRKWNAEFIDMPVVEKSKQNTPSFSAEVMSALAKWKYTKEQMLFILCGATGLRIGEALGLEIDKHISSNFLTISIKQKARHCKIENRLKTESAARQVDLHPSVAARLREFVGERRSGFLFQSRNGRPLSSSNILKRHLHPALKKLGYLNPATGTHKAGNHAFRRFRNTYLRNYTDCPPGLRQYWLGHAGRDMDDLYDKIKEDVSFRQDWAEKSGVGFELPAVVPNVPKNEEIDEADKAA